MAVTTELSSTEHLLILKVSGKFDFDCHRDFRDAYASLDTRLDRQYVIDLQQTDYMDSAALGMLLMLREWAGGTGKNVTIKGARGVVRQVLEISKFGDLFVMT